ncbi:MAG: glycoside hydrolase family 127 protein [Planctomycetes bacterium]|nr:glycoside hydrolase family 127 protein [Planctomycetota bacterium]
MRVNARIIATISFAMFATQPIIADDGRNTLTPVPFTNVHLTDEFWAPRIETNRRTTIPYCFTKCQETGRIDNFAKAAGLIAGEFQGIYYNDSDVYKVIEGASYSLAARPDTELDAYLDDLIAKIAAAQQPDGYLNTYHTLVEPDKKWTNIRRMHELYCAGHLIEAAVAHHQATGKRTLLNVAINLADHIESVFGPGKRHDAPGHQEIEIGLVKLARVTGNKRYLNLAKFFLDQRGRAEDRETYGPYCQDHKPVVEQTKPVGHAVRAMYQYCGMADVAAITGDEPYLNALDNLWRNEVETQLYITGGVGARRRGEAFGGDYELPNATAYNETCAAIGNAMWNHRMNLLHANAKYADVLERIIYNGFLSGVSLSGDRFFYPNPLESDGEYHRSEWFNTSCCPVNVVRFVPSIAGYVFAHDDHDVFVNLYVAGSATLSLPSAEVKITQQTQYPWDGDVRLTVELQTPREFAINLRIPGWVTDSPVPSDLYSYVDDSRTDHQPVTIHVNGEPVDNVPVQLGYARLDRMWSSGDVIELQLPMPIRLVRSHEKVEANRGRVAIQRGPMVYCLEAMDVDAPLDQILVPVDVALTAAHRPDLLGGVTMIRGTALVAPQAEEDHASEPKRVEFTAIPYYAWDHRDPGAMMVWIPTDAPD